MKALIPQRASLRALLLGVSLATTPLITPVALSQGMPPEARNNIHQLFNNHAAITRTVTLTKDGYVALTESSDPKVTAALRGHVQQMSDRLKSGLMVRRHDPAFVEYAAHYDNIAHTVEPTDKGLKVTVTGKTPDAIKVAQNHATVVTDFASNGWAGHDRDHAKALGAAAKPAKPTAQSASSVEKAKGPCCESGGQCCQGGSARKSGKGASASNGAALSRPRLHQGRH
jgi:hypothetical protein